jgi:hypothetical protein
MSLRALLGLTPALELPTAAALLLVLSVPLTRLFGQPAETAFISLVGRLRGAALFAFGLACIARRRCRLPGRDAPHETRADISRTNAACTTPQQQGSVMNLLNVGVAMRLGLAALLLLGGCSGSVKVGPEAVAGLTPDGTVDMNEVQVAYIGSGGGGSGTLYYHGRAYPFTVGGLGIGGIGASTIDAAGEVYKLHNVAEFPGAYAQGRYGFALGVQSGGDLWLQNEAGVIMHLKAKREGLMLSLGGDAVAISMK